MSNENNELPEPTPPAPPAGEVGSASTALKVQESPPPDPPPATALRSPGWGLLAIFAGVLAIAAVVYAARERQPDPARAVETPSAVTIDLPAAAVEPVPGTHDAPAPPNPMLDKIFNDAGSAKEILGDAAPSSESRDGFINELPPAPHTSPDGGANQSLRDAAKDALKRQDADRPLSDETPAPETSLAPSDARALAALEAASRRALAFSALAAKARSGAPYTEELRDYLAEPQEKPLPALVADRAAEGAPTLSVLAAEFSSRHRTALAAGRLAEAKGLTAKFGARFASLINLRPARPSKGSGAAAILSRIEAALGAGNLNAALAEADMLGPEAAAALEPWLRDARARAAIDETLAEREQALLASLRSGRL
ncbi:MAG: hypothetical protein U5J99_13500 [Parvularculaceae bacterium]|nr:hypothetical protein [Parvularculaceae bacterium]